MGLSVRQGTIKIQQYVNLLCKFLKTISAQHDNSLDVNHWRQPSTSFMIKWYSTGKFLREKFLCRISLDWSSNIIVKQKTLLLIFFLYTDMCGFLFFFFHSQLTKTVYVLNFKTSTPVCKPTVVKNLLIDISRKRLFKTTIAKTKALISRGLEIQAVLKKLWKNVTRKCWMFIVVDALRYN